MRDYRGFSLTELMVGAQISGFLMIGVLSTFLLLARTGVNILSYTEIESKARRTLEEFSREVRMAYAVGSYSDTSVTLSIPDTSANRTGTGTGAYTVTYAFDTTNNTLNRTGPPINEPTGTVTTTTMVTGVHLVPGTAGFLTYFRYVNTGYASGYGTGNIAGSNPEIKQIEVSFLLQRSNVTVVTATNKVLSARFILRNK